MTHFAHRSAPSASTTAGSPNRWQNYLARARTCFRAATVIDSTAHALTDAANALEGATDSAAEEAARALREAERALARARKCLASALDAKKLTPANREPGYGLTEYGALSAR